MCTPPPLLLPDALSLKRSRPTLQTLFVVLGAHTLWWRLGDEQRCYKPRRQGWTPEALVEELRALSFEHVILLLESPWVLTQLHVGIALSPQELRPFAQQQLQPSEPGGAELNPFPLIGVATYPQDGAASVAYLCVGATSQALALQAALQAEFHLKVELQPLLGLLLNTLPESSAESWALHGLEDWHYLEQNPPQWKKLVPMPKLAEEQLTAWAQDVQGCDELSRLQLRPRRPERPQEPACVELPELLEQLPAWETSFQWLTSEPSGVAFRWEWALLVVGVLLLGAWAGFRWVPETHLKVLQQDLRQTEQQLVAHQQHQEALKAAQAHVAQQEQLAQIEAKIAVRQAWFPPDLLDSLLAPLSLAWLEAVHYEAPTLQLELLTLRDSHIPRILRQLEAHPRVHRVALTYQDYRIIQQRSVIHMQVQLNLTPPPSAKAP